MRLEIRRRRVKSTEQLRTHLTERLRLALGRFARHIGLVRVYLRDLNGPRGGVDQECRMVVELPPRGRVIVAGVDTGVAGAIARAAQRAGFAVKRYVQRRRARRRTPRRPTRGLPVVTASARMALEYLPSKTEVVSARSHLVADRRGD